jgi:hypothetical protein
VARTPKKAGDQIMTWAQLERRKGGGGLRDWEVETRWIFASSLIVCSIAMLRIDFQQGQGEMSSASAWCAMCCMELEQRQHTLDYFASGAEDRDAPHNLTLAVLRHVVRCVAERGGASDPGWRTTIKCLLRAAPWLARKAVTENLS